jgi:DNA-directed RNA polymerase specialized sigma24 family protein
MEDTAADRASHSMIDRAFLAAHLLTANIQRAEDAAMAAIALWNPDDESEEALFRRILEAAAHAQVQQSPPGLNNPDESGSYLPKELKAVLELAPQLRRCFVLRILAGLNSEVCARLLGLQSDRVEEYTRAALQSLGARHCDRWRAGLKEQS